MPEPTTTRRTRTVKPKLGMKKLTIYLTEQNHAKLEAHARNEGGICPRPANETLSNLIDKHFSVLVPGQKVVSEGV